MADDELERRRVVNGEPGERELSLQPFIVKHRRSFGRSLDLSLPIPRMRTMPVATLSAVLDAGAQAQAEGLEGEAFCEALLAAAPGWTLQEIGEAMREALAIVEGLRG